MLNAYANVRFSLDANYYASANAHAYVANENQSVIMII